MNEQKIKEYTPKLVVDHNSKSYEKYLNKIFESSLDNDTFDTSQELPKYQLIKYANEPYQLKNVATQDVYSFKFLTIEGGPSDLAEQIKDDLTFLQSLNESPDLVSYSDCIIQDSEIFLLYRLPQS